MSEDQPGVIFGNDMDGYRMPTYDSPAYHENLKTYEAWRKLWTEKGFEDTIGSVDRNSVVRTKEIILQFPYHPDFPEVFFAYLVNRLKGCPPLQPGRVDTFLEDMYGKSLERPDCDYLLAIIRGQGPHPIQAPENIQRAIQWLEVKREKLPIWPPLLSEPTTEGESIFGTPPQALNSEQSIASLSEEAQKVDFISSDSGKKAPSQISEASPFERVLRAPIDFSVLKALLLHVELIGSDGKETGRATASAWAWVVCALQEKKLIAKDRKAPYITSALHECFNATVELRMIQYGLYDNSALSENYKEFYDNALSYIKDNL